MKIAVTHENGQIFQHFGHTEEFKVYEVAEGKIVKIVKHEKDTVVGIFKNSKNFGFVVPDDKKFGTDIFVAKKYDLRCIDFLRLA